MSTQVISIQLDKLPSLPTTIHLTGSKSECNRALILWALSEGQVEIENISEAHDSQILQSSLEKINSGNYNEDKPIVIDIGPAGTAMRFLTAYLCLKPGPFILTGTARMQERPIKLLVDALHKLGAKISYEKENGYPPLLIAGNIVQQNNKISIPGNISSQYLSALLLIAAKLPQGLALEIENEITSRPYLEMTIDLLKHTGIEVSWNENTVQISPQNFKPSKISVEPDWSAASYWYTILAAIPEGKIFIPYLKSNSLQGDRAIVSMMENFGVSSTFTSEGLYLQKSKPTAENQLKSGHLDFINCPDIAQSIIVLCAVLKLSYHFSGLETLKIKETNRIEALQIELSKIGATLTEQEPGLYYLNTDLILFPESINIATYEDHRMAMAFAVLATRIKMVTFDNKDVVNKSYPNFWNDLEKLGILHK